MRTILSIFIFCHLAVAQHTVLELPQQAEPAEKLRRPFYPISAYYPVEVEKKLGVGDFEEGKEIVIYFVGEN